MKKEHLDQLKRKEKKENEKRKKLCHQKQNMKKQLKNIVTIATNKYPREIII